MKAEKYIYKEKRTKRAIKVIVIMNIDDNRPQ
jgi:hypothetical protein